MTPDYEAMAREFLGHCICSQDYLSRSIRDPGCLLCSDLEPLAALLKSVAADAEKRGLLRAAEECEAREIAYAKAPDQTATTAAACAETGLCIDAIRALAGDIDEFVPRGER